MARRRLLALTPQGPSAVLGTQRGLGCCGAGTHTHTHTQRQAVRGTGKAGPRKQTLNMQLKLGLSEVGQLRAAGQGGEG